MSSAGWFTRAKTALELAAFCDRLLLFAPPAMHGASLLSLIEDIPHPEIRAEGLALIEAYRRAAGTLPVRTLDQDPERRRRRERRARTDQGREADARAAQPGNLVK